MKIRQSQGKRVESDLVFCRKGIEGRKFGSGVKNWVPRGIVWPSGVKRELICLSSEYELNSSLLIWRD